MTSKILLIFLVVTIFSQLISAAPQAINAIELAWKARYILHHSNWASIGTISTQKSIKGYPFVSIESISDGTSAKCTGIPYLYMSELEASSIDLKNDNRCTLLVSLLQNGYCEKHNLNPQDPKCAKLYITGKFVKIPVSAAEHKFAQDALFDKHPSMKSWPKDVDHGFYIAKIDIEKIELLDEATHQSRTPGIVNLQEYFKAKEEEFSKVKF